MTEPEVAIRQTEPRDDAGIISLTQAVYPGTPPSSPVHLASHREIFPEGQFVAVLGADGPVVGMAASLIILWDDYEIDGDWQHFTQHGMFTNHDPEHGRTLEDNNADGDQNANRTRGDDRGPQTDQRRRRGLW